MTRTMRKHSPLLLGVTGGVASGKSTVTRMIEELGALLIDMDHLARVVVEPEKPAWREILACFGKSILLEDGTLNRKKLAGIVFQDPEKRRLLEKLTHPRIYEEFERRVEEIAQTVQDPIIQAEVPLLFEVNLDARFHKVLVVYVPPDMQVGRLMQREGIGRAEAMRILNAQLPIDEKARRADYVIRNEGTLEETRAQVEEVWKRLKEAQGSRRAAHRVRGAEE